MQTGRDVSLGFGFLINIRAAGFLMLARFNREIAGNGFPGSLSVFCYPISNPSARGGDFPYEARAGSARVYVTTIHLFSGDTINQNKLGWERENRLPALREAARGDLARSKFLRGRSCTSRPCFGCTRVYTRVYTFARVTRTCVRTAGYAISSCVYNSGVCAPATDAARPSAARLRCSLVLVV